MVCILRNTYVPAKELPAHNNLEQELEEKTHNLFQIRL